MRIVTITALLIVLTACQKQESELIVLGTIHFPTGKVDAESIYNVLKQVKPDFILMEADTGSFNPDFSFKKTYDENEFNAIVKYRQENPDVEVRPIEFTGRNAYRKRIGIFPEAGPVFRQLNQLDNDAAFSPDQLAIWNRFADFWEAADSIGTLDLQGINRSSSDQIIDSLMRYQYSELKRIVSVRPEFKQRILDANKDSISLVDYFNKWTQFEGSDRNNGLSNHVKDYIGANPGKRFIVVTGFKHRFHVRKQLMAEQSRLKLRLREFYDK